ncbi:hypothetical protein [Nodosilinea nodulosa]|uniref:hypothetical protein n=1 Tax=Nodosilinea nodulosa TaxID=416001 RepID=UPI00037C7BDF|nr:hypothetical protein [Nodosilinea nodulosa]
MLPHEEAWDLKPENGHVNAQSLLIESYYWDCVDENSPLGSDTGADILSFYSKAITSDRELDPVKFIESTLESWEMLIDDWSLSDEASIKQRMVDDPHTIRVSNEAVIALAFAMYVMHGDVDPRIRDMAIIAVDRESTQALLAEWCSARERSERLADFRYKLTQMRETR